MTSKLSRLSDTESSSAQALDGVYHVIVDLHLPSDKKVTLAELERKVAELGGEDLHIERYTHKVANTDTPFNVGDTIELVADFNCKKAVYLDIGGNLVISDKPVTEAVEKVGDFDISLPKNTFAEVNRKPVNGSVEILFTGESVQLEDLERVAYLGVLEMPCHMLVKSEI